MADVETPSATVEMAHASAIAPARAQTVAIAVILTLSAIFAAHVGAPVLVPLLVSLLLAYALEPVVGWLMRRHVPRVAAALLVYLMLAAIAVIGARTARSEIEVFLDDMPPRLAALQE